MEVRTAKRLAQIEHIRSKPYYSPLVEEPDPLLDETVSTRMWKHAVKLWIETLKRKNKPCTNDRRRTGPDVMAADDR